MVQKVTNPFVPKLTGESVARGRSGDVIYDALISAVISGDLEAGMNVHDGAIAAAMNVSRTPVREALQRLRVMGVVASLPNRHTRVVETSPRQVRDALITWTGLFDLVCEEVMMRTTAVTIDAMNRAHDAFVAARSHGDNLSMARTNLEFYAAPTTLSGNEVLKDASMRAMLIIRLGGLRLPDRIDIDVVERAQYDILESFRARDRIRATRALRTLRNLPIPQ